MISHRFPIIAGTSSAAFTLVELAVVLVVIGLIIGSVLVGQDLIKAAIYNAQASQIGNYDAAVNTFKTKYNMLPGDGSNAVTLGVSTNTTGVANSCLAIASPISYNGNGNGVLETYSADTSLRFGGELVNFWIHMGNAGLISPLPGIVPAGGCQTTHTAGITYPKANVGNGIIAVSSAGRNYYVLGGFGLSHGYDFSFSVEANPPNIAGNFLTPSDAYAMDVKLDDANPLTGNVKVIISYLYPGPSGVPPFVGTLTVDPADNTNNCVFNGSYNHARATALCTLSIRAQ